MRIQFSNITLVASFCFALAFTFSCSSDGGEDDSGSVSSSSSKKGSSSSIQSGVVLGPSVSYGGETYQTVVIGTQTWFKRNLNYEVEGSVCYNDDPANCAKYGHLYNWATAMALPANCNSTTCTSQISSKHKGICPSDWHIPSNADWDKLMRYVDGTSGTESPYNSPTAGRYLKATSGWNDYDGISGNGEDIYGFSALPGGIYLDGHFSSVGLVDFWWSASEDDSDFAYFGGMLYDREHAVSGYDSKYTLVSVRCLQD